MKVSSTKQLNTLIKKFSLTKRFSSNKINKTNSSLSINKMSCPMKDFDTNGVRKDRVVTTSNGLPYVGPFATQRIGEHGPLLLQDNALLDNLAHFNRERIPERNPHAHGSGAFGYFEVTHDITDICGSAMFDTIGKKTKTLTRFSTVGGEKGSADTVRDPRGFATKFYTEEGNLDWVYNATPVFFIRDPSKFPAFIHTQKRNPQTNLKDADMFWDYLTTPENQVAIHQLCILFGDRGIPQTYRNMDGFSGHAYKWSNKKGEWHYVQVHIKTDQGIKNYTSEEAAAIAGRDPDICHRDLFENIKKGNFPSWTVYIQTMTEEESKKLPFSVFDLTKVWPHEQFPLRPVGKLVLNENPQNFFAQVEQAAFAPSNTVPYQEASADPVLQGRLFAYADAQRHRIGPNYNQVPVNCPVTKGFFNPLIRDGAMNVNGNFGSESNYYNTNSKYEFVSKSVPIQQHQEIWNGPAIPYEWVTAAGDIDFVQATDLYRKVLSKQDGAQARLAHNVASHAANCTSTEIQQRVVDMFTRVDAKLGNDIKTEISSINSSSGKPKL